MSRLKKLGGTLAASLVLVFVSSGCLVTDKMWADMIRTEEQTSRNVTLFFGALALTPLTAIVDVLLIPVTLFKGTVGVQHETGAPPNPIE